MAQTITADGRTAAERTVLPVLATVSFCHLLNDMMQSMLPAIYPLLKAEFQLDFGHIGLITLAWQLTASLLQPAVGLVTDRRPMPYSLAVSMAVTLAGMVLMALAGSYALVLVASALIGIGSAVFHPEASRIARTASGGRHGFAQSLFQLGGATGSSIGPLLAAAVVLPYGQSSLAWVGLAAVVAILLLTPVGTWYKRLRARNAGRPRAAARAGGLSPGRVRGALAILLALIFSKYVYLTSLTSYYTFYLISTFGVSVQTAQLLLFVFLTASAVGTFIGGPLGDRFGRKVVIWGSIVGALPFTVALPHVGLAATVALSVAIGFIISSAFSAIVVYGQELVPGKVGMISGLFFGFAFGMAGAGAAVLGVIADWTSIQFVYGICAFLPFLGLLTWFLPNLEPAGPAHA